MPKPFSVALSLAFFSFFDCSRSFCQNILPADRDSLAGYDLNAAPDWAGIQKNVLDAQIGWMHEVYLVILCGFCGMLLLFLYRSTKENGILFLSLAVLCWFLSGCINYLAIMQENRDWVKVSTSVCSTANSVFLLLMLSHLDPVDLPPRIQTLIAKGARQFVLWVGIFIGMLYILFYSVQFWQGFYFADMVFSGVTLALLFISLGYIFKNRVSLIVAAVSWLALAITLIAHIFRALPQNARHFLNINELEFLVWGATLMFSYKPLLIVTFFALIVSWLWKRLKTATALLEEEKNDQKKAHLNEIALLREQWEKKMVALRRQYEMPVETQGNLPELERNRKMKYPRLDETDWTIVERIAKGDKVPAITRFLGVKDGFVPPRIEKIAGAFSSSSSAQIDILRLALLNGVLTVEQLKQDGHSG